MKGSSLKNAAIAKRASFHLGAAPSLSHFLSFLFLLSPAAFNNWRHIVEPHQKPYRNFTGRCIKVFLSVHCDLLGCAPQWVSAPLRMRQLNIVLFCWAFKKCLCECGFMCVWAALRYCAPLLANRLLFLMGCDISHCGVCFRESIVIRPICRPTA